MDFLAEITEHRVREALIEGLDALFKQTRRSTFEYSQVVGAVAAQLLGQESANALGVWQSSQQGWKRNPNSIEELPDNRKLLSAIWNLVGAGMLIPRFKNENDVSVFLRLSLTDKGERLVSGADQHPLHPNFIKRFRAAAPTAIDAVIAHLEDAVSCLEAGVLRPALMMVGLANEVTIRVTHAALAHGGKVKAASPMAKTLRSPMKSPDEMFEDFANPHAWLLVAENLHDQAVILHERRHDGTLRRTDARGTVTGQWPTTNRGALLLGGFAIENMLKGLLVFEHPEWISNGRLSAKLKSHSLTRLREMSTLAPSKTRYGWVLKGFERGLISWARYPCALTVAQSEDERVLGDQLWAAYLKLMVAYVKRLRRLLTKGWTGPHGFYGKFTFT